MHGTGPPQGCCSDPSLQHSLEAHPGAQFRKCHLGSEATIPSAVPSPGGGGGPRLLEAAGWCHPGPACSSEGGGTHLVLAEPQGRALQLLDDGVVKVAVLLPELQELDVGG